LQSVVGDLLSTIYREKEGSMRERHYVNDSTFSLFTALISRADFYNKNHIELVHF
jgi:hypothetical protein